MLNANDIELLQKAIIHVLTSVSKKRILRLLKENNEEKDQTSVMNYVYSITKVSEKAKEPISNNISSEKATRYKLSSTIKKRILKILEHNKDKDKLTTAMNYIYSITKVGVRGTK